jgi:hypothetical protein
MSGPLLRNWFVPRDGINRQVISADIQKYLGNDATVRPGKGEVKGKEVRDWESGHTKAVVDTQQQVEGYWIKAYRNLTTVSAIATTLAIQKYADPSEQEMTNDLRLASTKWEQEQRSGKRGTASPLK